MSIIVNLHNQQEEQALIAFLDRMQFDYTREEDILSEAQQQEIIERDRQYEAGETTTYSLNDIIAHFDIKDK